MGLQKGDGFISSRTEALSYAVSDAHAGSGANPEDSGDATVKWRIGTLDLVSPRDSHVLIQGRAEPR